jgi:hypothetical protein
MAWKGLRKCLFGLQGLWPWLFCPGDLQLKAMPNFYK